MDHCRLNGTQDAVDELWIADHEVAYGWGMKDGFVMWCKNHHIRE
jgi:hypothetical protein